MCRSKCTINSVFPFSFSLRADIELKLFVNYRLTDRDGEREISVKRDTRVKSPHSRICAIVWTTQYKKWYIIADTNLLIICIQFTMII